MCRITSSALLPTLIATSLAIEGGTPSRRTVETVRQNCRSLKKIIISLNCYSYDLQILLN
jgi:hypothetical protein